MSPTPQPARTVLLVDDNPTQLKLGQLSLIHAGFVVETAVDAEEALRKATANPPTAILSDVVMGELDGFALCRRVRAVPELAAVPVVLASALYCDAADRELARHVGASALVQRTPNFDGEIEALEQSLVGDRPRMAPDDSIVEEHLRRNACKISRLAGEARGAEQRFRSLLDNTGSGITLLDTDGVILEASKSWLDILGVPAEQLIGSHIRDVSAPGFEEANVAKFRAMAVDGRARSNAVPLRRADGAIIHMEFSTTRIELDGRPYVLSIGEEVTEQLETMRRLAAAEERYRSLIERIPDVVWTTDDRGAISYVAPNITSILGFTPEEMCAEDLRTRTERVHPDDRDRVLAAFQDSISSGKPFDVEYRRQRKDGAWVWLRNRSIGSTGSRASGAIEGLLSDVTEKRQLEETFRQAQKMEAIGQLTGGIAHDFNNILAVVQAYSQFLIDDLGEHDPRRADAEEIAAAAQRAAALTRQLLAFSRRQVLEPTNADLNAVVTNIEKMLRRSIGEDIDLSFVAGADLGTVHVDVGQIEQVLLNLAVNARDAMPTGGRLSIETANVELDDAYADGHRPVVPGRYVMLAVSDSGCGMDLETQRRIFEPFFTTKEVGKGTGLGLSTCYGIVKQSGGYIWVYSEVGKGTVFKVYLPRVDAAPTAARRPGRRMNLQGSETILLIEDDTRVRVVVSRMLESCGYRVLVASEGHDALTLAAKQGETIDLVLSDVVMPGASGPEVVAPLQAQHPSTKVLYMSGYTDHAILRSGALEEGVAFIQKPFTPDTLAKKVREVLDA